MSIRLVKEFLGFEVSVTSTQGDPEVTFTVMRVMNESTTQLQTCTINTRQVEWHDHPVALSEKNPTTLFDFFISQRASPVVRVARLMHQYYTRSPAMAKLEHERKSRLDKVFDILIPALMRAPTDSTLYASLMPPEQALLLANLVRKAPDQEKAYQALRSASLEVRHLVVSQLASSDYDPAPRQAQLITLLPAQIPTDHRELVAAYRCLYQLRLLLDQPLDERLAPYLDKIREQEEAWQLLNREERAIFSQQEALRGARAKIATIAGMQHKIETQQAIIDKQQKAVNELAALQEAEMQRLKEHKKGLDYWHQKIPQLTVGGLEPTLPTNLEQLARHRCILSGCMFSSHELFLIPGSIAGKPVSLATIHTGTPMSIQGLEDKESLSSAYWLLMMRLPASDWDRLQSKPLPKPYRWPTALEMSCYSLTDILNPRPVECHVFCSSSDSGELLEFYRPANISDVCYMSKKQKNTTSPHACIVVFEVTEANVELALHSHRGGASK